jgi:flagellar hook-basal body complex protein FliE
MDLSPIMTGLGGAPASPKTAATQAMEGFGKMLREGETQSTAAVTSGADPHSLVTALAESKLAVDTVVTVRDRVVEAYQEILRMPV